MQTKINNNSSNFRSDESTSNQSSNLATATAENNLSDTISDPIIEETFFKKIGLKLDKICSRVMGIDL